LQTEVRYINDCIANESTRDRVSELQLNDGVDEVIRSSEVMANW